VLFQTKDAIVDDSSWWSASHTHRGFCDHVI